MSLVLMHGPSHVSLVLKQRGRRARTTGRSSRDRSWVTRTVPSRPFYRAPPERGCATRGSSRRRGRPRSGLYKDQAADGGGDSPWSSGSWSQELHLLPRVEATLCLSPPHRVTTR